MAITSIYSLNFSKVNNITSMYLIESQGEIKFIEPPLHITPVFIKLIFCGNTDFFIERFNILDIFVFQSKSSIQKSVVDKYKGFFGSIISVVGKSTVEIMEPFLV